MDERAGEETPKAGPAPKPFRAQTIIALVVCCGVLFWAYRRAAEGMRPSTQWIKLLKGGDVEDRQVAARQLGDSGAEEIGLAIPPLLAALSDRDDPVRAAAASSLGTASVTAIKAKAAGVDAREVARALVRALADEGPEVRMSAASALGELAASSGAGEFPAEPAEVASALVGLLADPATIVRKRGEIALFKLAAKGPIGPPAALIEGLKSWPSKESRAAAAIALALFGSERGPTVRALIGALGDGEPEVRSNAAVALQRLGPDAGPALPALTAQLGDPFLPAPPPPGMGSLTGSLGGGGGGGRPGGDVPTDPAVQAALAIGRIATAQVAKGDTPPADLIEALTRAIQSARPALRDAAGDALRRIGKGASAAIPALIQRLVDATSSPEGGPGAQAAALLGEIAPETARAGEAILGLTSALDAEAADTRRAAVVALGKFGPAAAAALPRLRELGEDKGGDLAGAVRAAADRIEGKAPPAAPARKGRGRGGPARI